MRRGCLSRAIFRCLLRDGPISRVDCPKLISSLEIDDEAPRKSARKRQKAPESANSVDAYTASVGE
jgi:hypothetical protein